VLLKDLFGAESMRLLLFRIHKIKSFGHSPERY
jgi:hypothetical protein